MMTHSRIRIIQKILLLLFTIICLLFSIYIYQQNTQSAQETIAEVSAPALMEKDTIYLYDYLPSTDATYGNDAVSWWYSEQDHFYYFFLPAQAKDHPVKVAFSEDTADTIVWGDQTYHSGDVVTVLTSGVIAIIMNDTSYPVTVLYGDQIPTMMIDTDSHSMEEIDSSQKVRESGSILISDPTSSYYYDGALAYIKGRGNSSFGYDKKSYQIKFNDKQSVCGMNNAKKWVLLPQLLDKTSVRNPVTFGISDALGLQYTPDYRYVNLYLNGSYHGLYLLTEKVEVSQSRVKIRDLDKFLKEAVSVDATESESNQNDTGSEDSENTAADVDTSNEFEYFGESDCIPGTCKGYLTGVNPDDITGGYLLELELPERYSSAGECGFVTTHGQPVIIKSPEYASKEEVEYISSWYQEFEDALYSDDGINSKTGLSYTDYVDLDSLVAKYLVEEYVLNPDAGKTSQFFYKPNASVSRKMYAGPVWDYDLALGGLVSFSHPEGLWASYPDEDYNIYSILSQHNDFLSTVKDMYAKKLLPYLNDSIPEFIAHQKELLSASAYMSAIRWNYYEGTDSDTFRENYDAQFSQLTSFISERADYLTSLWINEDTYHTVTFDTEDCDYFYLGTDNKYTVLHESCIELFYDPVKYGYTFQGFLNASTGEPFDMSTPIVEDGLILKPVFTK